MDFIYRADKLAVGDLRFRLFYISIYVWNLRNFRRCCIKDSNWIIINSRWLVVRWPESAARKAPKWVDDTVKGEGTAMAKSRHEDSFIPTFIAIIKRKE